MIHIYPFLAYIFVTTFTPGPNNILSMSNAMSYGYQKTVRFLAGIFSGFLVVMLVCGLLNFVLLSLLPQIKFWLNILGAAYMLYLAFHIIFSKPPTDDHPAQGLNTFKAGFVLQFLNLKVILYGITVFSNFIVPAYPNPAAVATFAPLLALVGLISTSCWAVSGELFRRLYFKYHRAFNLAMGALLIYTAAASVF